MIKITFLGTSAAMPTKERNLSSIAIHAKEWMLFDCGEGTQRQMMKYSVPYGRIKSIFITHPHLDHFLGIYGLLKTYKLTLPHRTMPLFLPKGVKVEEDNVFITQLTEGKLYENSDYEVHAFKVKHKSPQSFGFILQEKDKIKFYEEKAHSLGLQGKLFKEIQEKGFVKIGTRGKKIKLKDVTWVQKGKKIVYTGDTIPCKEVLKAAKGADLLIHESTFLSKDGGEATAQWHSSAKDAATIAKKAKVKQLILTHLSSRYKDDGEILQEAKEIFSNTLCAKDGFTLSL